MEIIISANESILSIARKKDIIIDEEMTEEDFFLWTQGIVKDETENGIQTLSF